MVGDMPDVIHLRLNHGQAALFRMDKAQDLPSASSRKRESKITAEPDGLIGAGIVFPTSQDLLHHRALPIRIRRGGQGFHDA